MTASIPYLDTFTQADGSAWGGGWISPGPDYNASCPSDVLGFRGRIHLGSGFDGEFSARLSTDDTADYKVTFRLDIANLVSRMTVTDTLVDSHFYLWVRLENDAEGVDRYEIYMDPSGVYAGILKYTTGGPGYPGLPYTEYTGDGAVIMSELDLTQPIILGIEEVGTSRSFKVWQGTEPPEWLITDNAAPLHTGPRYIDLYAFAQYEGTTQDIFVDSIGVAVGDSPPYIFAGETDHFTFWYDPALGSAGLADATAAMAYAEGDLLNHFAWFGNTAPWLNGPAKLPLKFIAPVNNTVPDAAAYYEGFDQGIFFIWDKANGSAINSGYRGMFVHEVVHHFQNLQGNRWSSAESMLEAQATFLDREFRRTIGDFASLAQGGYADRVPFWIASPDRPDYVNNVVGAVDTPGFGLAVGCTLLFFNYLRWHRGYSPAAITQHAGGTMRAAYEILTGDRLDPFPKFLAELDAAFPRAQGLPIGAEFSWPSKDIANPYPLPGTTDPLQPGGAGLLSLYNFLGGPGLAGQIRQSWNRR